MEKSNKRLCGAKFNLLNCDGCVVACGTTDERGLLCFDCLPLGKYFVVEVEAPHGYCPCKDVIPVELCCKDPSRTLEVFNDKIEGKITIVKYGKN